MKMTRLSLNIYNTQSERVSKLIFKSFRDSLDAFLNEKQKLITTLF